MNNKWKKCLILSNFYLKCFGLWSKHVIESWKSKKEPEDIELVPFWFLATFSSFSVRWLWSKHVIESWKRNKEPRRYWTITFMVPCYDFGKMRVLLFFVLFCYSQMYLHKRPKSVCWKAPSYTESYNWSTVYNTEYIARSFRK